MLESESSVADVPEEVATAKDDEEGLMFNFEEEVFSETRPLRVQLSRSQKRAESRKRMTLMPAAATSFKEDQQADVEIQNWRSTEASDRVGQRDGLLYHIWKPRNNPTQEVEQLMLPKSY